jgi:hypothetical protein
MVLYVFEVRVCLLWKKCVVVCKIACLSVCVCE